MRSSVGVWVVKMLAAATRDSRLPSRLVPGKLKESARASGLPAVSRTPVVTTITYVVFSFRNEAGSKCSVVAPGSQVARSIPIGLQMMQLVSYKWTVEVETVSGSIAPSKRIDTRGSRLKPSNVLMASMFWQSDT